MEDDHPYDYYETQIEERSEDPSAIDLIEPPAPPREAGSGWSLHEKFRSGAIVVFRWRRKRATKAKAV